MKTVLASGTLMLAAMAAMLTANVSRKPQAPTTGGAGSTSQNRAGPSATKTLSQSARSSESATAPGSAGRRKIPCKTPENASLCYWTHGRLSVYNGNPSSRIWKIGTRRMLGVFNGPSHFPPRDIADDEDPEMPVELNRAYDAEIRRLKRQRGYAWGIPPSTFADFEVCPLEPKHEGWMESVCIESARNIFVEKDD